MRLPDSECGSTAKVGTIRDNKARLRWPGFVVST
jgi:hypothetical protein